MSVKKGKKKERRIVQSGMAHVQASFNNTIVTITDMSGNTVVWASAGNQGFKGSRKSTPFAAQRAGEAAARKAMESGMRQVDVYVNGPGSGRESAIRSRCRGRDYGSISSVTSRRSRTTDAGRPNGVGCKSMSRQVCANGQAMTGEPDKRR